MAVGDRVPFERRDDIINVFDYVKAKGPSPPSEHVEWLVECYNTYIEPSAIRCKKATCRTDVTTVLRVISTYVKIWKRREENSLKQ